LDRLLCCIIKPSAFEQAAPFSPGRNRFFPRKTGVGQEVVGEKMRQIE